LTPSLQDRWNADVGGLPGAETAKASAFDEIIAAHSQAHRRYHGVGHLEALFALLDKHAQSVAEALPLHFGVWWHDVVYEPQASDNEARSAALARARLTEMGAAHDLVGRVDMLILATRNHWEGPTMGDGDYFLDADIAILGAPQSVYDQYADDFRAEYSFAPDPMYRAGRSQFLSKAIERQALFRKAEFEAAYGAAARENMRRELGRLGGA
jgi:predicted metal-dependent HD superfamily phosphohydrolase